MYKRYWSLLTPTIVIPFSLAQFSNSSISLDSEESAVPTPVPIVPTIVIPLSLAQFSNYSISLDSEESTVSAKIGSKIMANRVMIGILYTNHYSEIFVNTQCAE